MNFTKSNQKEKSKKMFRFKTNIEEVDNENANLFKAAGILEKIGHEPNPSANQFYAQLALSDLPVEEHDSVILAAMAIETMMLLDTQHEEEMQPTIH